MDRLLRRWPPLLWLLVYVGSLFVLMGGNDVGLLIAGVAMILLAFGGGVFLAGRRRPAEPHPRGFWWAMAGLAAFYGICAAVAGITLGWEYAAAALVAGLVPGTALALMFAAARARTRTSGDDLVDVSPHEDDDPLPAIGMDNQTALGDTPELSDAQEDPVVGRRRRLLRSRRRAAGPRPTTTR